MLQSLPDKFNSTWNKNLTKAKKFISYFLILLNQSKTVIYIKVLIQMSLESQNANTQS